MSTMILTAATVLIAACLHRVSGMGFALVAMPVLIILLGPEEGVKLGLLLGLMVSVVSLGQAWQFVDLRTAALLAFPSLASIPLGVLLAKCISASVLLIVVGAILAVLLGLVRFIRPARSKGAVAFPVSTGLVAGFVHALSGLSAPLLTAYAIASRWQHQAFIASSQIVFIVFNTLSIIVWGWSSAAAVQSAILSPVLLLGAITGTLIRRLITAKTAVRLTLTVAWISAVGAIA